MKSFHAMHLCLLFFSMLGQRAPRGRSSTRVQTASGISSLRIIYDSLVKLNKFSSDLSSGTTAAERSTLNRIMRREYVRLASSSEDVRSTSHEARSMDYVYLFMAVKHKDAVSQIFAEPQGDGCEVLCACNSCVQRAYETIFRFEDNFDNRFPDFGTKQKNEQLRTSSVVI